MSAVEQIRTRLRYASSTVNERYESLSDREQKLVVAMAAIFCAILVLLPMYFVVDSISVMEAENASIKEVLREIEQKRVEIRTRIAEQNAAKQRYQTRAPALGSFLESHANRVELTMRDVADEPEQVLGGFTRRRVRATFQNIEELGQIMSMLENIENSNVPVSISKLEIDRPRNGTTFTMRLGVDAYDRNEANGANAGNSNSPEGSR